MFLDQCWAQLNQDKCMTYMTYRTYVLSFSWVSLSQTAITLQLDYFGAAYNHVAWPTVACLKSCESNMKPVFWSRCSAHCNNVPISQLPPLNNHELERFLNNLNLLTPYKIRNMFVPILACTRLRPRLANYTLDVKLMKILVKSSKNTSSNCFSDVK